MFSAALSSGQAGGSDLLVHEQHPPTFIEQLLRHPMPSSATSRCEAAWTTGVPPSGMRTRNCHRGWPYLTQDNHTGCSQQWGIFDVRLQSALRRISTSNG